MTNPTPTAQRATAPSASAQRLQATPTPADPLAGLAPILPADKKLAILQKGPAKTGKSRGAYTFPPPVFAVYTDPNRLTVQQMQEQGFEIDARRVTSWVDYERKIVPAITNRLIDAQTIVLDTIDMLLDQMWRQIQGSRSKLAIQDFGTGLQWASDTTYQLVSSTMPRGKPGDANYHPGYNIIVNVHVKDVTNDSGALVKVCPSLMGQFKDDLESYFDAVLICDKDIRVTPQQGAPAKRETIYKVLTQPPDRYQTAGAPADWPPEFVLRAGENLYDKIRPLWGESPDGDNDNDNDSESGSAAKETTK